MQDPAAAFQVFKAPPFPEQEQHLRCPRCDSTNTKFCYYNNYNLSQPRHFCKNCRRYWTKGGALRNIPVGGGTRKNSKRSSSSSPATSPNSSSAHTKRSNNNDAAAASTTAATASTAAAPPLEIPKIEPCSAPCHPADPNGQMLHIPGSFSSLLASTGHFGNLLESLHPAAFGLPPSSNDLNRPIAGSALELQSPSDGSENPATTQQQQQPVLENFLGMQGDSGCWNGGGGGWPDLAIYTPGSNFQ